MLIYQNAYKLPTLVGLLAILLALLGGFYWEQFLFGHTQEVGPLEIPGGIFAIRSFGIRSRD